MNNAFDSLEEEILDEWANYTEEEKYAEWSEGAAEWGAAWTVSFVDYANFWDDAYGVPRGR